MIVMACNGNNGVMIMKWYDNEDDGSVMSNGVVNGRQWWLCNEDKMVTKWMDEMIVMKWYS